MKKLLTLSLIAFASFSYAFTADEIVTKLEEGKKASIEDRKTIDAFIESKSDEENKAFFDSVKNEEYNKFQVEELNLKDKKLIENYKATGLWMAQYLLKNRELVKELPLRTALLKASTHVLKDFEVDNPALYQEIKAKNFIIDDKPLPSYVITNLILASRNYEDVALIDDFSSIIYDTTQIKNICKALKLMSNVSKAKSICNSMEREFILKDKDIPEIVSATSSYLTKKVIESQVSK